MRRQPRSSSVGLLAAIAMLWAATAPARAQVAGSTTNPGFTMNPFNTGYNPLLSNPIGNAGMGISPAFNGYNPQLSNPIGNHIIAVSPAYGGYNPYLSNPIGNAIAGRNPAYLGFNPLSTPSWGPLGPTLPFDPIPGSATRVLGTVGVSPGGHLGLPGPSTGAGGNVAGRFFQRPLDLGQADDPIVPLPDPAPMPEKPRRAPILTRRDPLPAGRLIDARGRVDWPAAAPAGSPRLAELRAGADAAIGEVVRAARARDSWPTAQQIEAARDAIWSYGLAALQSEPSRSDALDDDLDLFLASLDRMLVDLDPRQASRYQFNAPVR